MLVLKVFKFFFKKLTLSVQNLTSFFRRVRDFDGSEF